MHLAKWHVSREFRQFVRSHTHHNACVAINTNNGLKSVSHCNSWWNGFQGLRDGSPRWWGSSKAGKGKKSLLVLAEQTGAMSDLGEKQDPEVVSQNRTDNVGIPIAKQKTHEPGHYPRRFR